MKNLTNAIIILLILAVLPMPYGYYSFLRVSVFIYLCFLFKNLHSNKFEFVEIICILLAILYNPIIKVGFSKEIWICLNLLTIIAIFSINKKIK